MTALVLDILTTAAILFAVASGLLIILGVLKIVNFAHGGFLTIGGYSGLVVTQLGLNAWLAYPAAVVAGIVMGAVIVASWISHGFGSLSYERLAVVAFSLLIVGIQIFFSSFLLSILGLRRR